MTEPSKHQPGDKVVALSSLARAVGVASALAAAICYQVMYGVPDFLTTFILFASALIPGIVVGWLISIQFASGGRDRNTTVVKHGRDGAPVTVRTALLVAIPIAVIFILIVKFGLGFDGNVIGLVATIAIPAILTAVVWALLGSLA